MTEPAKMQAENAKVLIIIPAYNEGQVIANVVREVKSQCVPVDVLVVNDGSRDNTAQVAEAAGAMVVSLPTNLGIGGAVQTGYRFAAQYGYDIAVQLDGDGQHDPADLVRVIDPVLRGEVDMSVGSRYVARTQYKSSTMRRIGMIILAGTVRLILGYAVKDTTSGYRAANRRVIELFSRSYPSDYPEPESLIFLHRHGYRIREVSVDMRVREAGKSSITPFKSMYYMIKVLLSMGMNAIRSRKRL